MIALLSCISVSLLLTFHDSDIDLHIWNTTKTELSIRSKPIIAHFRHRSSKIFIIDTLCLLWAIDETILRTLSTIGDAYYYLTLIISTVGYGDVYPMSQLARFAGMLASPLSIMMLLSVPLSSIYSKYISLSEIDQMQLTMLENVLYLIYDNTRCIEEMNESLKPFGISQQLQEELDRREN